MNLLIMAAKVTEHRIEKALRKHGLTYPQFEALRALRQAGGMTMGELCEVLTCSRGNITGITDRLERDGWVERRRSTEDRRVVDVVLIAVERLARVEAEVGPVLADSMPHEVKRYLGSVVSEGLSQSAPAC